MNPLKYLPKIHKRDKCLDKCIFYRAIIDDVFTPSFKSKALLYDYIRSEYSNKTFVKLNICKVTVESLIY